MDVDELDAARGKTRFETLEAVVGRGADACGQSQKPRARCPCTDCEWKVSDRDCIR